MRVKQVMTSEVRNGNRLTTADEALCLMKRCDVGFFPIVDEDVRQLIGVVTDRDIIVRAVIGHLDVRLLPVTDVMTESVVTVKPDDTLERALRVMALHQVRRLPVLSKTKELVGVITLGDIVRSDAIAPRTLVSALRKLYTPSKAQCADRSLLLKTCAA